MISRLVLLFCIILQVSEQAQAQTASLENQLLEIRNTIVVDYITAKKQLRELESLYLNGAPEDRFKIYIEKINLYASIGDLARVKYELNKARIFKEIYDVDPVDLNYLSYYSAVYQGVKGDFDSYYQGIKDVYSKVKKDDYFLRSECLVAFSRYYQFKENSDQANAYLYQALKVANESKNKFLIYQTISSAGQIYFFDENFDAAEQNFNKSYKIALDQKWLKAIQYARLNLGEFYLFNGQAERAKKYLDSVLMFKNNTENRDIYQAFSLMEHYYLEANNIDSAYQYLDQMHRIDDVIEEEQRQDLTTELEKDFQSEKQKALLEIEKKKNNVLQLLFMTILVVALVSALVFILFIRQKNKSNKLLIKQRNEINEKNIVIGNSLRVKENLLKEIHHRVKNNLQVVSSILNLQSKHIKDSEALRIIEEGKDRIFAISLIHNQLYLNEEVAFVEMRAYLEKLIDQVNKTYGSSVTKLHSKLNIDKIELSIDDAVPVGLILCELLTNAYKHAFKGRDSGTINIDLQMSRVEKGMVNLKFWDDGIGYKNGIEFLKLNSTGVEIISALIQQLDAKYTYLNLHEGFGIQINFPILSTEKP